MALIDVTEDDLELVGQSVEISDEEMEWLNSKLEAISEGVSTTLMDQYFLDALKTEVHYRLGERKAQS